MIFKNVKQQVKETLSQKKDAVIESLKEDIIGKPKTMIKTYGGEFLPKDPSKPEQYWSIFLWAKENPVYSQMVEAETDTFREIVKESHSMNVMRQHGAYKSYVEFLEYALPHYYEFGQYVGDYFKRAVCESEEAKQYRERYKYIDDNLEMLLNEENEQARIRHEIEGLKTIIFGEIVADEGMVQSDYIKTFPDDRQKLATVAIKALADEGCLERIKFGRSYKLYTAEGRK